MRAGGAQHIPRPDTWRVGPAPAWRSRDVSVLADLDEVVNRLAGGSSSIPHAELSQPWVADARASAVLIPLVVHDGAASVVLTRRADHLRNHRGEVSFPGGRMEEGETPWQTALREAHEEIALPPDRASPVVELAPLTTFVSNSLITPVVARIDVLPELRPDPAEVARVFTLPLVDLVREDTYSCETWSTPRGDIDIHFFHLDDETVWGATARMLHALVDAVTRPT